MQPWTGGEAVEDAVRAAAAAAEDEYLAAATRVQSFARGRACRRRRSGALGMVHAAQSVAQSVQMQSGLHGEQLGNDVDYMQSEALLELESQIAKVDKQHDRLAVRLEAMEAWPSKVEARLAEADRRSQVAEERALFAEGRVNALAEENKRLESHLLDQSRQLAESVAREEKANSKHERELVENGHRLKTLEWKLETAEHIWRASDKKLNVGLAEAARHAQDSALRVEAAERAAQSARAASDALVASLAEKLSAVERRFESALQVERSGREADARHAMEALDRALSGVRADSRQQGDELIRLHAPVQSHTLLLERLRGQYDALQQEVLDLTASAKRMSSKGAPLLAASPPDTPPSRSQAPMFQSPRSRIDRLIGTSPPHTPTVGAAAGMSRLFTGGEPLPAIES